MLGGKKIVLGVCGGIAAYKMCEVVSTLKKCGASVVVIMTKNATQFVAPLTFETLSGNRVIVDMFDRDFPWEVEHVSLAKSADLFVVAPATANFLGKFAAGIADDFLTTTLLATAAPALVCPAMNTGMLNHPAVKANIKLLASRGVTIMQSGEGRLACGDSGAGRLPEPAEILQKINEMLLVSGALSGKTVLITAGATSEPLDAVRFITNRSSGKMGIEIAKAAHSAGAHVILVTGAVSIAIPPYFECVTVKTTGEMYNAVVARAPDADFIIMAAAPSDYRPATVSMQKIKSEHLELSLVKNPDIAKSVGAIKRDNQKLIIFCAETENLLAHAHKKMQAKHADMVVANDITQEGAGFEGDTNIATIITADMEEQTGLIPKSALAQIVVERMRRL